MRKSIYRILILLILLISLFSNIVYGRTIDYKNQRPPGDIRKPEVGMKIRIDHQDGRVTERSTDNQNIRLDVTLGDKVTIYDASTINNTGASLSLWDYQYFYVPQSSTVRRTGTMPATLGGQIDSFTLDRVGRWEFYLSVMDNQTNAAGSWQNWSENGQHTSNRISPNDGIRYLVYFVRADIEVHPIKVESHIFTDKDTYHINANQDSIAIPVTVISNAKAYSGQVNPINIKELKATFQGHSASSSNTNTVLKRDYIATRANYPVGTHQITLEGVSSLTTEHNTSALNKSSKTITLIVSEKGDEPFVTTTVTPEPREILFDGNDVPIKLNITGELHNYTNIENIKEWQFFAREKEVSTAPQKKNYEKELISTKTYDFTIPKNKIESSPNDIFIQEYVVTARVWFNSPVNGKNFEDAQSGTFVRVFKKEQEPPIPEPNNLPPVAIITAPHFVKAGDDVYVSGLNSYDPDGTVVGYNWLMPSAENKLTTENSGYIWYPISAIGNNTIELTVRDDKGSFGNATPHTIIVTQPTPTASLRITGSLKENRKITIDGSQSSSPTRFPLDHSKTKITIEAITGNQNSIRYSGSLNGVLEKDMLIKQQGTYRITLYVENTLGYSSTTTQIIRIEPDIPPRAYFSILNRVYRNRNDSNFATIDIHCMSFSPDRDIIADRIWTITYNDNNSKLANGQPNFSDNTTFTFRNSELEINQEKTIIHNGEIYKITKQSEDHIILKAKEVGNYLVELEVVERFGQETILEFIQPSDYKRGNTKDMSDIEKYTTIWNRPPSVDFAP